jgi:hypothetical protein
MIDTLSKKPEKENGNKCKINNHKKEVCPDVVAIFA